MPPVNADGAVWPSAFTGVHLWLFSKIPWNGSYLDVRMFARSSAARILLRFSSVTMR